MSEIVQSLQSPGWWFSAIVVAIIANVIASYLYEFFKARMSGKWLPFAVVGLSIVSNLLLLLSLSEGSLGPYNNTIFVLAIILGVTFGTYSTYKEPEGGLPHLVTLAIIVSMIMLFDNEFPLAWSRWDTRWLLQQYFVAYICAIMISIPFTVVVQWRLLKRRQRLRR